MVFLESDLDTATLQENINEANSWIWRLLMVNLVFEDKIKFTDPNQQGGVVSIKDCSNRPPRHNLGGDSFV